MNLVDPLGLDVVINYYCCHLPNVFGHTGIGIDSGPSRGFYDPGQVVPDSQKWNQPSDAVRIPTTSEQDQAIRDYLDRLEKNPGRYRPYGRNWATSVQDALKAGGIDTGPQTRFSRVLMKQIQQYLESVDPH